VDILGIKLYLPLTVVCRADYGGDTNMSKTTQRIFRAVSFMGTLACLWLATFANTGPVQARQQGQYGLTLSWVGGDPPRFMCIGDYEWMLFVISFAPDPNFAPLAPLVSRGQPTPVPPPAGGSLDIKATKGTLDNSHWRLDFRTASQKSGVFRYEATTDGQEDLTLTYNYNDSVNNYTGSTPVHFRVQRCDYRVKLTLQETGTLHVRNIVASPQQWTTTGEGGFRIKYDERNGRGNIPFSGSGVTEIILQGQVYGPGAQGAIMPVTGQGKLQILGEILPDGTLEMDIIVFDIALPDAVISVDNGFSKTVPIPQWTTPGTCLDSMHFPGEGGTQSCSGPGHTSASPNVVTYALSTQVTVSWE